MSKTYHLDLSAADRQTLETRIRAGSAKVREIKHAQVLLKLGDHWPQKQIAAAVGVSERTVIRLKQRYEAEGCMAAIVDKARSGAPVKIDGALKAVVVATACSPAPDGHRRWTLRLLADKLVTLDATMSLGSIQAILKKMN